MFATGYVHRMLEQNQTFDEFVWNCARAFGALVMMRDDPLDAPIPQRLEPDDYYQKRLQESIKELHRLTSMTEEEKIKYGEEKKLKELEWRAKYKKENEAKLDACERMLKQVRQWNPPTDDHQKLKNFMIGQLWDSTANTDDAELDAIKVKSPIEFYEKEVKNLESRIPYYKESYKKELESTEARNKWLLALQESIPIPKSLKEK